MNFLGIGGFELVIIAGLALFLLGPKKMIETSRSAGKLIRELKTERDKFTNMVMVEFDDAGDKTARPGDGSTARGSGSTDDAEEISEASVGAVKRPRGRMQGLADESRSDVLKDAQMATPEESDDPDTLAGGSA
ncbi:MAG: twin-arginine translocase TatA/TatE family subunit [Dehalococcoidia bacterium]